MREILFRGKDNNTKGVGWVYGYYVKIRSVLGGEFSHMIYTGVLDYDWTIPESYFPTRAVNHHVDPASIGEYTGLTDKNGVKIFCGDIVRSPAGCWPNIYGPDLLGTIEFFRGCFSVRWHDSENYGIDPLSAFRWLDVVGNIYDNPPEGDSHA